MTATFDLRIITPLVIIVDQPALALRAVDASGSFGILPRHCDFLTRLGVSVVQWNIADKTARYCALRGGALRVKQGQVSITTREAVLGDDLETLDREVIARFHAEIEQERADHTEGTRLHLNVMRQMLARLQPKQRGANGWGA